MKIKSIKSVNPRTVYAIKTSTNTFIADGLAHHNCVACNVFLRGNYTEFAKFMYDSYSKKFMENLQKKSKSCAKISTIELQEMYEKYKNEIT